MVDVHTMLNMRKFAFGMVSGNPCGAFPHTPVKIGGNIHKLSHICMTLY